MIKHSLDSKLKSELRNFYKGLMMILDSINYVQNQTEYNFMNNMFNGFFEKSEMHKNYFFSSSFDEELFGFSSYLISLEVDIANLNQLDDKNVLWAMKGMSLALQSLENTVSFLSEHPSVKDELLTVESDGFTINFFEEYGFETFYAKFLKWHDGFHQDLKNQLSEKQYNKIKLKALF